MKRLFLTMTLLLAAAGTARAQLSPMNAAGVTYGHVHLNVPDVEVHKKLFVDIFGGTFVQKGPLMTMQTALQKPADSARNNPRRWMPSVPME